MDVTTLNQRLQAIYQPYLAHLYSQQWSDEGNVSAPLLMHVFEPYARMRTKVLFVGQETHGWDSIANKPTVDLLQRKYASFDLGKQADYGDSKKPRYLRSPFWNFNRSCFYRLNPDRGITKQTNGFLWTNISKFDSNGTTPHADLQQQNRAGFELLKQELAIIQPDVVVFLTGQKYDYWLDELFQLGPDCREPLLAGGLLSRLHDPTRLLPALSFQTSHPRTLSLQKSYHTVLDKVVAVATAGLA